MIDGRAASTSIYFLLKRGERSHWHRVDAVEIWHYYAGAPLKLEVVDGAKEEIVRLGADIHAGEVPQFTVPVRAWQAAESTATGRWSAARSRPAFPSTVSSWRRRTGRQATKRDKKAERTKRGNAGAE